MFDIRLEKNYEVIIVGHFDAVQVDKAETVFNQVNRDCTVNCKDLEYISSAGIGVLLATYKRLYDLGFNLRLINLNPYITKVLTYAGMAEIFIIQNSK